MANYGTGHEWLKAVAQALTDDAAFSAVWTVVTNWNFSVTPPTAPTLYLEWLRTEQAPLADEDLMACGHALNAVLVWPYGADPEMDAIREDLSDWGQKLIEILVGAAGVPSPTSWSMEYGPRDRVGERDCAVLLMELVTELYTG